MKYIFYIILLISFFGHSQASLTVEYDVQLGSLQRKGFLKISKKHIPYYYELTKGDSDKKDLNSKDGVQLISRTFNPKADENRFQLYNNARDTLFNIDYLNEKSIVYYEIVKNIEWDLTNETKLISTYSCKKANGFFRGRKYIVWYTTDLPIYAGPWKFNNLPGLIISVSDETLNFVWNASKITFNTSEVDFKIDKNLTRISQNEFVNRSEDNNNVKSDEFMLKFLERGAVLVSSKNNRGRELKYDWEK